MIEEFEYLDKIEMLAMLANLEKIEILWKIRAAREHSVSPIRSIGNVLLR